VAAGLQIQCGFIDQTQVAGVAVLPWVGGLDRRSKDQWFGVRSIDRLQAGLLTGLVGQPPALFERFQTQGGEEDDVADGLGVGEEHEEAVDTDAQAAGGG
jgi:hypothetical protein